MELILSELFSSNSAKMTSLDMEVITGKRHDSIKRTIETLANKGLIAFPQNVVVLNTVNNREYKTDVFVFEGNKAKRDSLVVVAQLSPEFTADLVDRWIYLEQQNKTLTQRLEQLQAKEIDDAAIGSLHGKGLAERRKTKEQNESDIQDVLNQMQPRLNFDSAGVAHVPHLQ